MVTERLRNLEISLVPSFETCHVCKMSEVSKQLTGAGMDAAPPPELMPRDSSRISSGGESTRAHLSMAQRLAHNGLHPAVLEALLRELPLMLHDADGSGQGPDDRSSWL